MIEITAIGLEFVEETVAPLGEVSIGELGVELIEEIDYPITPIALQSIAIETMKAFIKQIDVSLPTIEGLVIDSIVLKHPEEQEILIDNGASIDLHYGDSHDFEVTIMGSLKGVPFVKSGDVSLAFE